MVLVGVLNVCPLGQSPITTRAVEATVQAVTGPAGPCREEDWETLGTELTKEGLHLGDEVAKIRTIVLDHLDHHQRHSPRSVLELPGPLDPDHGHMHETMICLDHRRPGDVEWSCVEDLDASFGLPLGV